MESMLQFLQFKSVFNDSNAFRKENCISEHLTKFEKQMKLLKADKKDQVNFLINSFDSDCHYELFAHKDYSQKAKGYNWILSTIKKLFDEKQSTTSHLR